MISLSNVLKQWSYENLDKTFHVKLKNKHKPTVTNKTSSTASNDVIRRAESRAKDILHEAALEADRLKTEAKQSIDSWWKEQREKDSHYKEKSRQKGYDEGYQQGYEQGIEKAEQEMEAQLVQAREIVDASYNAKQQIISEAEPFLVNLSIAIAEKVIARQMDIDKTVIVQMVRHALEKCHEVGTITVMVKPEYYSLVQEAREELKQLLDERVELKIAPDHTLTSDGCVVHSHRGSIDARVDVQLDQIKQALLEVAKEGEPTGDPLSGEVSAASQGIKSDSR